MRNDEERSVTLIDVSLGLGQLRVKQTTGARRLEVRFGSMLRTSEVIPLSTQDRTSADFINRALVLLVARYRRGLDAAELLER